MKVTETMFQRFRGKPPVVETYPFVDVELLHEGDEKPFYVTLKILEVDVTSRNGLIYDEKFVSAIEQQLAGEGGFLGHLFFGSRTDEPDDITWVGHLRVGKETHGKFYVAASAPKVREHIKNKMATNGGIGTSIVVQGIPEYVDMEKGTFRLLEPELLSIDIVHHATASLRKDGAFVITSETANSADISSSSNEKGEDMEPQVTRESVINGLKAADVPNTVREAIIKEAQIAADAARVGELQTQLEAANTALETANKARQDAEAAKKAAEVLLTETQKQLEAANAQIAEAQRVTFETQFTAAIVATTANWNVTTEAGKRDVADFHNILRVVAQSKLGESRTPESITEAVSAAWAMCESNANALKLKLTGGNAFVPPSDRQRQGESSSNGMAYYKTPEGQADLRKKYGSIVKSEN